MNKKGIWAYCGPLGGEGASPLGLGAKGGPTSPLPGAPPLPSGFSPTWEGEGDVHPSLAYIRRGRVPLLFIQLISPFETTLSLLLLPSSGSHCLELVLG